MSFSLLYDVEKKMDLSKSIKKKDKINNQIFDEQRDNESSEFVMSQEQRETIQTIGKELWMLIRNHPEYFIDHTSGFCFDNRNVNQHNNENEQKLNDYRAFCTVASG